MVRVTVSTKRGLVLQVWGTEVLREYRLGTFWGYLGYIYLSDC